MGFLFVKNKTTDSKPQYTGLQVQTSSSSLPVPIIFGKNSAAPNLIWYDNFKTIETKERQGGKGGGSVTTTNYTYTADVILALCEGPIAGIGRVWKDKVDTTVSEEGLTLFLGANPQDPWPYLVAANPTKALAYNGLAYLAANDYALSSAATIRNHNFEVIGILSGSLSDVGNNDDADVALLIEQFMTNPQFGTYFPSAYIDEFTLLGASGGSSLQAYCKAAGFGLSPVMNSVEKAADTIERWLGLINATVFWSDGLLKFRPYAEESIVGYGYTWVAQNAPLFDLTDDDFVMLNDDDPVKVERIDVGDTDNVIRLEISDRANRYSRTPVESRDESAIQLYGLKVGSTMPAGEICSIAMASLAGNMILQRKLYVRNRFRMKLSWEYSLLEPMDVVTITDPKLGYDKLPVRIDSIEEDGEGELLVIAEELVVGLGAPTVYPKQDVTNTPVNFGVAAPSVNYPLILEAPISLTFGVPQIWVAASGIGADPSWGGAQIWVSTDDITYAQLGEINQRATQGVLDAALPTYTGANPDNANTLKVDLTQSAGTMISTTPEQALAGVTLCAVDDELLTYTIANLTAPNEYDLTGLYRGQSGSAVAAHSSGARFCRLDASVEKIDLPAAYIGKQLYIKFVSFNVFGQGLQDISLLTPYLFTPTGASYGFTNALLNRLAAGQLTDLGNIAAPEPGADLGSLSAPTTAAINLGSI